MVFLVDVTVGANAGTVVASVGMKDPGPQPIGFRLAYPLASVSSNNDYQLFAGIVDGDSAWATPTGTGVPVPRQEISGVNLELEYRPDLLKGAVTGTITGDGLAPIADPDAYGTSILIDQSTGQTIGFQMIEPVTAEPIPFSAPYNPSAIDTSATYVARGSVWTGTAMWNTPAGVAVITNGNPKSGVVLTVTESSAASSATSGLPSWLPWLLLIAAIVIGVIVFVMWRNRRETVTEGPTTPPPPPGPDSPPPPPGEDPGTPPPPPVAGEDGAQPDDEGVATLVTGDEEAPVEPTAAGSAEGEPPAADEGGQPR